MADNENLSKAVNGQNIQLFKNNLDKTYVTQQAMVSGLATKLGINDKAKSAGTADSAQQATLTVEKYLGSMSGKTIKELKEILIENITAIEAFKRGAIVFSGSTDSVITNWNAKNDGFIISGGPENFILVDCRIVLQYAALELTSYRSGVHYRCILTNGTFGKWEKVPETVNGVFMADRAMADSDGNILQQTYARKTDVDLTPYAKKTDIPAKLPSPNAVTFNGSVDATYDGSEAVTVTIPAAPDLTPYAKKEDIPTKMSQLTNDINLNGVYMGTEEPTTQNISLWIKPLEE